MTEPGSPLPDEDGAAIALLLDSLAELDRLGRWEAGAYVSQALALLERRR